MRTGEEEILTIPRRIFFRKEIRLHFWINSTLAFLRLLPVCDWRMFLPRHRQTKGGGMMQHVVVVSSLSRLLLLPLPLFCIPSDVAVTRQQHLQQQLCPPPPPPPQSVLSSNDQGKYVQAFSRAKVCMDLLMVAESSSIFFFSASGHLSACRHKQTNLLWFSWAWSKHYLFLLYFQVFLRGKVFLP